MNLYQFLDTRPSVGSLSACLKTESNSETENTSEKCMGISWTV